jgi:ATP-dependent RNA helicase DHX57
MADSWERTLATLNCMLVGQTPPADFHLGSSDVAEDMVIGADDLEALWGYWAEPGQVVLGINTADIKLHCLVPPDNPHITASAHPPMFISSPSVPAYIRLHLLSTLLSAIYNQEVSESGTGFLVEAMGVLDATWTEIEQNGPPDISMVLKHLMPQPERSVKASDDEVDARPGVKNARRNHAPRRDPRSSAAVLKDFEDMCKEPKYLSLLRTRERLPSFGAKEEFLAKLDSSRVVVVVGETGEHLPSLNVVFHAHQ